MSGVKTHLKFISWWVFGADSPLVKGIEPILKGSGLGVGGGVNFGPAPYWPASKQSQKRCALRPFGRGRHRCNDKHQHQRDS